MEYLERGTVIEAVDKHLNAVLNKADDNVALDIGVAAGYDMAHRHCVDLLRNLPAADVRPVPEGGIGEMSDGYHTFNGLYYQRMVLFAALVKAHKDKAWKSWRHEDGELCFGGGWLIVGIDTPQGSYTYHYESKDWDMFDCAELPVAKHWDGHTEEDVTRLLSLDVRPVVRCGECKHWKRIRNDCILASCELYALVRSEDFFCADGERKDGDGE